MRHPRYAVVAASAATAMVAVLLVGATTTGGAQEAPDESARRPARPEVQVGGQWQTVAQVRGNVAGTVSSTFPTVTAEAVQIVALASNDGTYAHIVELEVFSG